MWRGKVEILEGESLATISKRIDLALEAGDLEALDVLEVHLRHRPEPNARRLRLRIINSKMKLKQKLAGLQGQSKLSSNNANRARTQAPLLNQSTSPPEAMPTSRWWSLLDKWGIEKPDGRPLHRYRLNDEGRKALRAILQERGKYGLNPEAADTAAFFALWAAHWFQCEYDGGIRRWDDLSKALGIPFDGSDGRKLAKEGLAVWKRKPVVNEATDQTKRNMWLTTLAVEGGFPAALLKDVDRWAGRYLGRVVGALLSEPSPEPEIAFSIAESYGDYVQQSFRQEIFYALAADLAIHIVRLRREAEKDNRARGIPASAWLDAMRPGWREELPIATDNEAAARLVDGLMRAEAITSTRGSAIGCERLLRREKGEWIPAVRLGLDGEVAGEVAERLAGRDDRLRAHPSGPFGRYVVGELALFEPPAEKGDRWRVRPSRASGVIPGVPFTTPIKVELRADGVPQVIASWPGGEPIRSEIGVFAPEGDLYTDGCTLRLIGTGTGGFKPEILVISVPADWKVTPLYENSAATPLEGVTRSEGQLWQVVGAAKAASPDGDAYLIRGGQTGDQRDRLRIEGSWPRGIECEEPDLELLAGPLKIKVCEGNAVRNPKSDEVRWRPDGERTWRSMSELPDPGRIEIVWKDMETGYVRDRRRIFVMGEGAALEGRRAGGGVEYQPIGFHVSALKSDDDELIVENGGGVLIARFRNKPSRRARFQLRLGKGRPLKVSAQFPLGDGIARWSGAVIRGGGSGFGARVTISELADCVAFADGERTLLARLYDRSGKALRGGSARWLFRDELPLRGVASDLAAMLLPSDIDVWADLSFLGGWEHWQVRQFEASLVIQEGRLIGVENPWSEETLPLFGRSMTDPAVEVELGVSTHAERINGQPPSLPEELKGGAWLLYLRRGDAVISRPAIAVFTPAKPEDRSGLAGAVTIGNSPQREAAILACLDGVAAGAPDSERDVTWLVTLCASLRGLPPSSLDPLRLLASNPGAAARIALNAAMQGAEHRKAVVALADALPFAWCMVPFPCWEKAARVEHAVLVEKLADVFKERTDEMVRQIIADSVVKLADNDPLLCWPLFKAGLLEPRHLTGHRPPLVSAINTHIKRHGHQVDEGGYQESIFRTLVTRGLLPDLENFHRSHWETLDAPCAAAAVAAGMLTLDLDAVRRIKTAFRFDPVYFTEAFSAHFVDLLNRKQ